MIKRGGFVALVGVSALLLAGCTGGSDVPESVEGESVEVSANGKPLTLGLTFVPSVQFAPVYVAAEDSIFTNAGLGVSIRHHGSDEGLFQALTSGDEDIVIASGDEVLQARAAGADIVAIGQYYNQYPVEIIVPEDSGIVELSDLEGKKIGLPGEFGSNWFGLLAALNEANLSQDDVSIVSVGYTQASALASGDVDAIVGFSNSEAVQLDALGFVTRSLKLADDVPLVGASIVTTSKWAEENGRAASGVVASLKAAMERLAANPAHALEVSAKWDNTLTDEMAQRGAKATLEATIPMWVVDGKANMTQNTQTWEEMAPFLANVLNDEEIASALDGAVTNQYTTG